MKKKILIIIAIILIIVVIAGIGMHIITQKNYEKQYKEAIEQFTNSMKSTTEMRKFKKYLDIKGIVALKKADNNTKKFNSEYKKASNKSDEIMEDLMSIAYENEYGGDLDTITLININDPIKDENNSKISTVKALFYLGSEGEQYVTFMFYKDKIIDIIIEEGSAKFSMFEYSVR